MKIEVLGPGCKRCEQLFENVQKAVTESGAHVQIQKVTEMGKILSYGVMTTPALVIDGKVIGSGKVFQVDEVKRIIEKVAD